MRCPHCQTENRHGRRFCGECGASFASPCPSCGFPNDLAERFCGGCGSQVTPAAGTAERFDTPRAYVPTHLAERILDSRAALEGERKQVTVLFADLQGSMELLADRDPEEARKVLDSVVEHMIEAVHRYEGTVNQVMGDGIMALFGAPLAHEDHAVRGCYAALRMQQSIAVHAQGLRKNLGITVKIRVGLNSGDVLVRAIRSDLRMEYSAVGQTTHLAARMEQIADPGSILLTAATYDLVEGLVQARRVGPTPIKGLSYPVEIFELTGAIRARSRLRTFAARRLTRFVGRTPEMDWLRRACERVEASHGQIAAIVGEPGVGKSRLLYEFTHSHALHTWRVLETRSLSYGKASSYSPVVNLIEQYFEIEDGDTPAQVREKVTSRLSDLDPALTRYGPACLWLLDVPNDDPQWPELDPQQRRQRALDAVSSVLLRETVRQPVMIVCEDLHWIDDETEAFLDRLAIALASARMLLLVSYRHGYQHGWGARSYYRQLGIEALTPHNTDEFLDSLLGPHPMLASLKQLLIERTDGNPFFLEETVRTLEEVGVLVGSQGTYTQMRTIQTLAIPATVQAILAARIDRLSDGAKHLLQAAAVVGTEVPLILLEAIADESAANLHRHLAQLQSSEFLHESRLFPDIEYAFGHVLTHDVAYRSLAQGTRCGLHIRIAAAIERFRPTELAEDVERLAHHSFLGESWEKAAGYSTQAGVKAQERSSDREAVSWFEQALVAVSHLPRDPDKLEQALDIRLSLRSSLYALGELETMHTHLREAEALAEELGEVRRMGWVAIHMGEYSRQTGNFREAVASIERARDIATQLGDQPLRLTAERYLGMARHAVGEYRLAAEHMRTEAELPTEGSAMVGFRATQAGSPEGFRAVSLGWLARCLAEVGEFTEGIERGREAIRLAEENNRPYTIVSACWGLGYLYGVKGDFDSAILLLDRALACTRGAGLVRLLPQVMRALGLVQAHMGRIPEGTALLEEALALAQTIRLRVAESNSLVLLGEVQILGGRLEEARASGSQALRIARERGQRGDEASALHLLGDVASRIEPADQTSAELHIDAATLLANELSMRPLLARMNLTRARLLDRVGAYDDARQALASAENQFRQMGMRFWLEVAEVEGRKFSRGGSAP